MGAMKKLVQYDNGYLNKTPIFQFILLSCLFPLWAAAASLNDILITQFKSVFELSDFASALVQSAFYGGYFIVSIPASMVIKKTTYKTAILCGLIFYIVGCSLFFPASHMATYTMFLAAVFAIAIGLGFLETSSNTYSTMLGPEKYSTLRLNISQTFYPVGAIAGILLGKYLIFEDGASMASQLATMTAAEAHQYRLDMLLNTLQPYKVLIFVLLAVFVLFAITKYPSCKAKPADAKAEEANKVSIGETLNYLAHNGKFKKGILTEFLYVGMQVAVWSFTIRLALTMDPTINERTASNFMVASYACFFIGKFIANFLLSKFSVSKVLTAYAVAGCALVLYVAFVPSFSAVYAAVAISILMGPCWATIYGETLKTVDEKYTATAGAVLVMSIIGGAVIPAIQGYVSDVTGSMQFSFIVNFVCFAWVGYYFWHKRNEDKVADTDIKVKVAHANH